jgi:hypothetical protein
VTFAPIGEALEEVARALAAGDAAAAASAAARVQAACEAALAAGLVLREPELSTLRALQQRALEAALAARDALAGEVERTARSRRAGDAYRRDAP